MVNLDIPESFFRSPTSVKLFLFLVSLSQMINSIYALFSNQGQEIDTADVNWILIQGGSGICVREMNYNLGNSICYYAMNDDFELRSSGTDVILLAKMISSDKTLFDLRFGRG